MTTLACTIAVLAAVGLLLLSQLTHVLGTSIGWRSWGLTLAGIGAGWWWLGSADPPSAHPADWSAVGSVTSASCARCHPDHHASWQQTYHRSMTREASPETIKGDFANTVHDYQGIKTRFTQQGDAFFMETVHPDWAAERVAALREAKSVPPPVVMKYRVDRLVGSHWVQECLHRLPNGRYARLPVLYHIAERRWVHTNGAFLAPDSEDFWEKSRNTSWNDTCLYCHNTGPSKNPVRGLRGEYIGYDTRVAELGISCEACHGPAEEHVRLNRNPARRFALQRAGVGDPSIIHPERLSVQRRDEICARCHGALVPKPAAWNLQTQKDPFIPGLELTRFNSVFWSEAEQMALAGHRPPSTATVHPGPTDGRFWGDGTPLTTALEYNGMALSACYQAGRGRLSCLSCHTMHPDDPNFMLKPGMGTNEACYQCHADYRDRLTQHTHHPDDSPGSLCYNCHMPHQVFSLLTTHRSHRIQNPNVRDSLGTGKPNACVLCHLDKSLGWVQDQLDGWSDRQRKSRPELSNDEKQVASGVLMLARGDARTRAVVAGAFASPAAHRASGTGWSGPFLARLLEDERYPMVRDLGHRGLVSAHPELASEPFDYLALPDVRASQLRAIRSRVDASPIRRALPYLPLNSQGLPDDTVLQRLRTDRKDPDLTINE